MACYRDGGCGPYEMYSCNECPASKPDYKKVKDHPPYLDYQKEQKKHTNADKYFRNATDEELAERLSKQNSWNCPPHDKICLDNCYDCWLDWLKQEVESDG